MYNSPFSNLCHNMCNAQAALSKSIKLIVNQPCCYVAFRAATNLNQLAFLSFIVIAITNFVTRSGPIREKIISWNIILTIHYLLVKILEINLELSRESSLNTFLQP